MPSRGKTTFVLNKQTACFGMNRFYRRGGPPRNSRRQGDYDDMVSMQESRPDASPLPDGDRKHQIVTVLPASPDGSSWEAWRRFLSFAGTTELLDPSDSAAFHAAAQISQIGPFQMSEARGSHAYRCIRTAEDIARSGIDHVMINLHAVGSYSGTCAGRAFRPGQGDVSCYTFGQPYDFTLSPHRVIGLMIPRMHLPERLQDRPPYGLVADGAGPLAGLLAKALLDVFEALPSLGEAQALAAIRAIVDLVEAVFDGAGAQAPLPLRPSDLDLYGRAQALVEDALGDPALSVETLARKLRVSRTALYAVFADARGVQAYIRERRLQRASEAIAAALRRTETLGAIAASLGFASEANFTRLFKQRFGVTPGRMRALAQERGVAVDPAKAAGVAAETLRSLGR